MPTIQDAKNWVKWADSVDPQELREWKRLRPDFNEEEVRKRATMKEEPAKPDKRQQNYNAVKDYMAEQGIDVEPNVGKDMFIQGATAPLRMVTGLAGLPGLVEEGVRAGSTALLEATGTAPQEKIDSYRQNSKRILPNTEEIEKFITPGGRGLPKPQTEPGRMVGRIGDAATAATLTPLSLTQKILAGTGMFLGGEGGREAAKYMDVNPEYGQLAGELFGPSALLTGQKGTRVVQRFLDEDTAYHDLSKKEIKRQLTPEDIQDVRNSSDDPGFVNPRTERVMAEAISRSSDPFGSYSTFRDADPGESLMTEISQVATGKSREQLKAARQEAFNTAVDTAKPYNIPEENVKRARELFRYNKGLRDTLDKIDAYGRTGKYKPTQTLRNIFEGNPKKSTKNVFVDPKQLQRFGNEVSSNLAKLDNETARKEGQDILDEVMTLLGSSQLKKARKLTAQEKAIDDGAQELLKIAGDMSVPELKVKEAISKASGVTDEAALDRLYQSVEKARSRLRVLKQIDPSGSKMPNQTVAERKFDEAVASAMAGLRKRALYLGAQGAVSAITGGAGRKERLMNDVLVDMMQNADHPVWRELLDEEQYSVIKALGQMGVMSSTRGGSSEIE